jgi:hypothetical protein
MLLNNISVSQLRNLLVPFMDAAVWPGLADSESKAIARQYAHESGLWDRLAKEIDPESAIPVLRYHDYQDYFQTGRRELYEVLFQQRLDRTERAALALWLDHPAANLDELQDLLWSWCESRWSFPAMDPGYIDLVSSRIGRTLAELSWLFRDRLGPRVQERICREIEARILNLALDWRTTDWWTTDGNNWNSVCNSNLIQTALYQIRDPWQLAAFVHPVCRRMDYALHYFTADGGCPEGVGYWEYGFGHLLDAALALGLRTGGKVNLAADPHVERICRFPTAVHLRGPLRTTFSDSDNGYLQAQTALKINRLFAMPELFSLTEATPQGLLRLPDLRTLALYQGQRPQPDANRTDVLLPQLGLAKLYAATGSVLAAVAGRNDVSHNHNDIGSFIWMVGQRTFLTDPGAPVYTSKTFGPDRYDILVCRSRGHSVPLVNGREQAAGHQYYGIIEAYGLNASGEKKIVIDMTHAYPDPTLQHLGRELKIDNSGWLALTDTYRFSEPPQAVEEAFITFENVAVQNQNRCVEIGEASQAVSLSALTDGQFAVETYPKEQHEGRDARPLHRITFTPVVLKSQMVVSFRLGTPA